jgi:predicted nucleotidyltransferase
VVAEPVDTRAAGPSMAELAHLRPEILAAATRHGASNVRVFGSVARGDADAASDVDFLVDFEPGRSLLDLAGLLIDLEDLLGHPVDVVTEPGLKARIRQRVLAEAVPV